jgi:DNA-binding CsgD family transcriptional regulator/tetratricopeptide (TPR) repeat protein
MIVTVMLFEREEQVAALRGYLAEAATGHGRLVFLAGEAGVGKTSLVGRLLADVADEARVAVGGCDGSATPAPLGPLVEMLPRLPTDVWPPEVTRQVVFARLVAALREPPPGEPYLLVVEDAHWADEATLDLVRHLARRVHECRAVVLVTYRPEDLVAGHPLRVVLGDAASATGVRRLDVPPLSVRAVERLAAEHAAAGHSSAPTDVARLHRVTGGNAFFVTEALSGESAEVPATVRDAVLARVARLSGPARAALDVVALCGSRAEIALLEDVLEEGLGTLDEALERDLLRAGERAVTFRHELARLAVADRVPAFRRIAIHRRILRALQGVPPPGATTDDARLAHHADAAGDTDAVLAHAPAAAARAAELGSHREAVRQYGRALRFADHLPGGRRADLLWALGYECYLTDRVDDAMSATQAALTIWEAAGDKVRVGDAYRCLSRLNWFAGRNDVAEEQAVLAVGSLEGSGTVELAMAYSNVAQLRMLSTDLTGTRTWGRRALDALEQLPDGPKRAEVTAHALNNLGTVEVSSGDREAGIRMLTSSLDLARSAELHEHAARAYCNLSSCAVSQRRHADAARHLDAGLEYCIDRDLDSWTLYLQGLQAVLLLHRGDHAAAVHCAENVLLRTTTPPISQVAPLVVLALARARRDEPGWSEPLARALGVAEQTCEIQRLGPVTAARCEIAWQTGDLDTAQQLAVQMWPNAAAADCPWNRGSIATWLGDPGACHDVPLAPPYALEVSGRWVEAAGLWRQLDSPHERALALARSDDRAAMTEAVTLLDSLGAAGSAARVRALLRARGWSPPRGPRPGTREHPAGLTAREAEVLAMLSQGLPDSAIADRLVISRRTVEHHVAAVLAKLGVRSRREAAAAQARALTTP